MSDIPHITLRAVDLKRLNSLHERTTTDLSHENIWYIHTVLASCFLPYRDPKTAHWMRENGKYSIILSAGATKDPRNPKQLMEVGLPYGAKPRLFQSYICTQVIKGPSVVFGQEIAIGILES